MDFAEARHEFKRLGQQYFAGKLSRADYHAEVKGIRVTDEQGRRWRIDSEMGTWQRMSGSRWVNADPDGPLDEFDVAVDDQSLGYFKEEGIPAEIIGATIFVILILLAAASIAYLTFNAMR